MKFKRCEFGHYYDPSKYETCPHCFARSSGMEAEFTVAKSPVDEEIKRAYDLDYGQEEPIAAPVRKEAPARPAPAVSMPPAPEPDMQPDSQDGDPVTMARVQQKTGADPVVGWLVQIAGANIGVSYEIHSNRNTIGRASSMDICLKGDVGISRDTNGVLSFDPRNRLFHLIPGEKKAIIYLNDQELLSPEVLQPYDKIEIGDTALLFVPFCGENFSWEE